MAYGFQYGAALTYEERILNLEERIRRFETNDRQSYPPVGSLELHFARAQLAEMRANPPVDLAARIY